VTANIVIEKRFNGPPHSGNGGYTCGIIAAKLAESVSVRLHKPPPLATPLAIRREAKGWTVVDGEQVIASAIPATVQAHVPDPPSYVDALAASRRYRGFESHAFPTCFVCGPERTRGDGLRIFASAVPGTGLVAAPWLPEPTLADELGKVRPEFIWAALDCPGYFASIPADTSAVLGEFAVHVDRSVHVEEPCVVVGWQILIEGRKHKVGTALFDEEGERCAVGVATWVQMKSTVTS
jgi:hypothetical protein